MHQKDLRRMSPLWLKYSEDVRYDPDVRPHRGSGLCSFAGVCLQHA